jgi:hypothetical protein
MDELRKGTVSRRRLRIIASRKLASEWALASSE